MSAGKCFVGFIRNGKVSVLRLRDEPNGHDGKLKSLLLKDNFRSIVCGGSDAVLLTHEGKVFTKTESPPVYKPLRGLDNRHVIQISCGEKHSMALTRDGLVFIWGENSHGQLGLGKRRSGSQTPQHVQCLDGVPLAQISAGGDHSFVLSLSGVVFGWGRNSSGQLGLGDTTDRHVPTVVKSLNGKKTQFISCGGDHTATLSKGGTVFTFGSGVFGQLGHNSFQDEHLPRVVAELWGSTVTQVACGRHHTLVLVASSKRIYSFGCGMQGQLGNGQMINQSVPSPVHLPADFNDEYTIGKVISGENHSFALLYKVHGNASINLEPNKSRGIVTLDDKIIDQWVSECNSNWKRTQNKINQMFSSAASLNGSFLKTSCDEHYQTSAEVCGLDFALVKKSFAKLSANEKVMSKVVETVRSTLLPASPATMEALRVYLLIPELIRVCQKQHRAELLEALACNTLQLHPEALKVLENYWSKLPAKCLKVLVTFFHEETSKLIRRIAVDEINWNTPERLQRFAQILQMVYKVCCSVHNNITKSDFIINEINDLLDTLQSITEDLNNNWWLHHWNGKIQTLKDLANYYDQTLKKLKSFPCIFNLEAKCRFLKNRLRPDCYELVLRRTALLEDCFSLLKKANGQQLKGRLAVFYAEDVGYRSDVNKRDFFLNVIKELREPDSQFFMYNDNKTMIWFPTQPTVEKEKYLLLGILCGLAFSNNCVVHLPFPLALFKKLFNVKPTLQDLKEFNPGFGQSLEHVLEYSDEDVFKKMEMEFTVPWDGRDVELDPSNPGKMVTNSNKTDFVDKCVDYTLNKSVEDVFEEFRRGFFKGCDRDLVEMFGPEELRGVLVGNEDYDWDILKQNTTYEGLFHARHSTIISFWQVFVELTSNQKKTFLLFLTGFERVPILGMSQVKMRVRNLFYSTEDHLPQALTCHALLELPVYQSKATLKEKLIEALNHRRGFWEE